MKKWKSKKSLCAEIAGLIEENQELHRQVADLDKENAELNQSVVAYSHDLSLARYSARDLRAKLSKFERQRGQGGRYIKNIK